MQVTSGSGHPKHCLLLAAKSLALRWVRAARPSVPAARWQCDSTDDVSPLVITHCYEEYLNTYGMLAVFAEQRGDDPEEALGPAPA